jgi:hypothetical protein
VTVTAAPWRVFTTLMAGLKSLGHAEHSFMPHLEWATEMVL